jgi:hypothetical protein
MMMKRLVLLLSALLLSMLTLPTLADDDTRTCTTDPDDGSRLPECGTRADNECYEGGTMAGKCDNEWLWKAGWEIARFNDGRLSRDQVNEAWRFLLPPPIELVTSNGPSLAEGCYYSYSWEDLYYYGPINTLYNASYQVSYDGSCYDDDWDTTIIYAADFRAAEALCASILGMDINDIDVYDLSADYPDIPYGFWDCYED